MTQEIFGYFLIRSNLMNNEKETLIKTYNTKDAFAYFVENVARLIEQEDFLLISVELKEKVEAVLYHYRFDYNKDKKINDDMNKIIRKLYEYKSMNPYEAEKRYKNWIETEGKLRGIPKFLRSPQFICSLISNDAANMIMITSTNGMNVPPNLLDYLAIINFIANKFPVILLEDQILDNIILNLESILEETKKVKFTFVIKKIIKNTMNNLKTLKKEIKEEITDKQKEELKTKKIVLKIEKDKRF